MNVKDLIQILLEVPQYYSVRLQVNNTSESIEENMIHVSTGFGKCVTIETNYTCKCERQSHDN